MKSVSELRRYHLVIMRIANVFNFFAYKRVLRIVRYLSVTASILFLFSSLNAQVCGTSGIDGPSLNINPINTYYPVAGNKTLNAGHGSIVLEAVPVADSYGNNYGDIGVRPGDLILIIQMQDALINYNNDNNYGSGSGTGGADALGGTGYTDIGFSGKFEYVIALNTLPITGGTLYFRGAGTNSGVVNTYVNAAATNTRGQRRFQIVRVPQYSNLTFASDITTVPYNGKAGGVIAFDVAGNMNFNGFKIDASEKGFRGGYGPVAVSANNTNSVYVTQSSSTTSVGKGEGIAGTPRYMFDGYKDFDSGDEGLPNGSYGKGAPANAGGGGNDHNAGGGGGGNGGYGGVGGLGWESYANPNTYPNGGRPGSLIPPDITRLIMGGGGGGGDANNATTGVKGGVGGGIILVNVEKITGNGLIVANGGIGMPGAFLKSPDGAGGGGAGGTVFVRSLANSAGANLLIQAHGGNGGNTLNDANDEHGPGGGGGGGMVYHSVPGAVITALVNFGSSGKTNNGTGIPHGSANGTTGKIISFLNDALPPYLKGGGQICYPALTTVLTEANPGIPGSRNPGTTAVYTLTISNSTTGGNAGGVQAELKLPAGFTLTSIIATVQGGTVGATNPPVTIIGDVHYIGSTNLAEAYNISPGGEVVFTINVAIANTVAEGLNHADAQSTYLDPTRTSVNPNRRVTAKIDAFPNSNTTHETGNTGDVEGVNYDGDLSTAYGEDVHINAKPIPDNLNLDAIECDDKAVGQLTAMDPDAAHTAATLTYTLEGTYDTTKGSLALNTDGTFIFLPLVRFFGTIDIKFRVTDPMGAYTIGRLTINQPKPLIAISSNINHVSVFGADDGSISAVASGGVGALTYSWLFPDGSVSTTSNINNLVPGNYTLTVTDINNCKYSETYLIREPPLITLIAAPSVCVGDDQAILSYTDPRVSPATYSIIWSNVAIALGFNNVLDTLLPPIINPATTANINVSLPNTAPVGTYTGFLMVKNAIGDSSNKIPFSIKITPYPVKAHIELN